MSEKAKRTRQILDQLAGHLLPSLPPFLAVLRPYLITGLNSVEALDDDKIDSFLNYARDAIKYIEG